MLPHVFYLNWCCLEQVSRDLSGMPIIVVILTAGMNGALYEQYLRTLDTCSHLRALMNRCFIIFSMSKTKSSRNAVTYSIASMKYWMEVMEPVYQLYLPKLNGRKHPIFHWFPAGYSAARDLQGAKHAFRVLWYRHPWHCSTFVDGPKVETEITSCKILSLPTLPKITTQTYGVKSEVKYQ